MSASSSLAASDSASLSSVSQWACENCTYLNSEADLTCTMCYQVRVSSKDVPVMWQWQAADEWIPYDSETAAQIEQAYQEGRVVVELSCGYFRSNAGYVLSFKPPKEASQTQPLSSASTSASAPPAPARHHQTNTSSGMRRRVRRLASDDCELLLPVAAADVQDDSCSICQTELRAQAEAEEQQDVVRLPHCAAGHAFHRSCIASWLKLKSRCPYCHSSV